MIKGNDTYDDVLFQNIETVVSSVMDAKLSNIMQLSKQEAEYISVEEAAKLLCIKVGTLYNWNSVRKIPYHNTGKSILYNKIDIIKFIESHRVKAADEIEYNAQYPSNGGTL